MATYYCKNGLRFALGHNGDVTVSKHPNNAENSPLEWSLIIRADEWVAILCDMSVQGVCPDNVTQALRLMYGTAPLKVVG